MFQPQSKPASREAHTVLHSRELGRTEGERESQWQRSAVFGASQSYTKRHRLSMGGALGQGA
eukprot:3889300-Rhodomonas_salina.2